MKMPATYIQSRGFHSGDSFMGGAAVGMNAQGVNEHHTQQELEQYLTEKGLQHLMVRVVEKLLVDRPDNPVEYIVSYMLETYPEQTMRFQQQSPRRNLMMDESMIFEGDSFMDASFVSRGGGATPHRLSTLRRDLDESMISEPDLTVDGMMPKPPLLATGILNQRRGSISAAPISDEEKLLPPVIHEKSETQRIAIRKLLPRYWVTAALEEEESRKVIDAMEHVVYTKGDVIIRQGDTKADHYFIISEGTCSLMEDGAEIRQIHEGEGFGELALLYNTNRMESVVAVTDRVELFRLDRNTFRNIVVRSAMERRSRHVAILSKVPLLLTLDERGLNALADTMQTRTYEPEHKVVVQGEKGSEFFVIEKGSAQVLHDGEVVGTLSQGDYFGEIALLDPSGRRAATVQVNKSEPLQVACIRREVFTRVLGGKVASEMRRKIPGYKRTPKRVTGKSLKNDQH